MRQLKVHVVVEGLPRTGKTRLLGAIQKAVATFEATEGAPQVIAGYTEHTTPLNNQTGRI